MRVLVDAGLTGAEMQSRLEGAGVPVPVVARATLDHVFVTHGHLDHARSAGMIARKHRARLHCAESLMTNASIRRCTNLSTLPVDGTVECGELRVSNVSLPHDAHPTVAFRIEHGGRVAVVLTDMGRPDERVARALRGAHVLVLEFNHDLGMLQSGPYPPPLKKRVAGDAGHLSNDQAARMLERLASENLHTLVLAHLSETNNTPEIARDAASAQLDRLGLRSKVRVVIAEQHAIGENLEV